MKKMDIMNRINPVNPGEECEWQIIDGKVQRIVKEIKIEGPVVKEAIEEVKIVKTVKTEKKKKVEEKPIKKKEVMHK